MPTPLAKPIPAGTPLPALTVDEAVELETLWDGVAPSDRVKLAKYGRSGNFPQGLARNNHRLITLLLKAAGVTWQVIADNYHALLNAQKTFFCDGVPYHQPDYVVRLKTLELLHRMRGDFSEDGSSISISGSVEHIHRIALETYQQLKAQYPDAIDVEARVLGDFPDGNESSASGAGNAGNGVSVLPD
jgi:hypothetical protein